ncbi:CDP-glycerol glycerophosphotransferase family protein [Microbacterium sp. NPDC058342]|uniref:bifunctional glycosyltransferase/CDP-glycerol:glycerophosphate glycerophosphotransferase n=1 Tax=Microbacterium sp. NPDC058342 TaxID=3346454 RepID=UPI00364802B0
MRLSESVVDFLGQPALLPARERVRALHKLAVGARSRLRLSMTKGYVPGMLSIVVPMYGVERYIGECLDSLLVQDYADVQIIVVDDGSPDGSYEIARRYARRDPRVQIVRRPNGGLSAARNTGVSHARGEFLAFLDSDDFVDRHTYAEAVAALRASGSDFTVSPYRREKNGMLQGAAEWIGHAHRATRLGATLTEFPEIMVNAVAWSKVYRRRFWDEHGFEFPVGLLYEDQALSMAAYAAAKSFDVLSRVSINWRIRGDQSSITQQVTSARNIADHATAVRDSLSALEARGHADARDIRVRQILNNNLREFLPNIRQMDEAAWQQMRVFLQMLDEHSDALTGDAVEARIKVLVALCIQDRRDLALRFLAMGGWERDHFAGTITGERLTAELPLSEEIADVVPPEALRFSAAETPLRAVLRRIRQADGALLIDALVYVNHLRMDQEAVDLQATLLNENGTRAQLSIARYRDAWSAYGHTRRYADMSDCAVTVTVPLELVEHVGTHRVLFDMRSGDFSRTGELSADGRSTLAIPTRLDSGLYVGMETDADRAARLSTRRAPAELISMTETRDGVALRLHSGLELVDAHLIRRDDRFALRRSRTPLVRSDDGVYSATIDLPHTRGAKHGAQEYALRVVDRTGQSHDVAFSAAPPRTEDSRCYAHAHLHRSQESFGGTTVVDITRAGLVTDIRIEDDALVVCFTDMHSPQRLKSVRQRIGSSEFATRIEGDGSARRLAIPLEQDAWGLGAVGLPAGRNHLRARAGDGAKMGLYLSAPVVARLPLELDHPLVRFSVRRSARGHIQLETSAPLRDEERGSGDRWRMRDWTVSLHPTPPRSVLFRNLYGESANDSALAVHRELRRRGSELELLWAVKDRSVHVPEGARTVLEESREYYEAFGTADYLMVNVHQPDWYRKPDGQVLIETFHGYPFKMNGRRWWQRLGFAPERQESFFRRAEEWDYLVSPARYATPILHEFFREGATPSTEILEIGYPRNDALLDEHAAQLREDTRRRLGIPDGKTAILYAPTFRDYMSGDDMTAELVQLFDPAELSRQLGDDYVLLLRGHPFNARSGTKRSRTFINVTDYPDINHLILASDVGVLDYSSLRFDYALTGKPTFYFVPDLERYFEGRDSFVPYEDTSPGPHVRTLSGLVEGIRGAAGVAADFEQARTRFIDTFMEREDGNAAARLVDAVFAPRGDA